MNVTNEEYFRLAFALAWLLSFVLRVYFQVKARNVQRSFARGERRARLGFRVLAIAYLLLLLYSFSRWVDFGHLALPSWIRWTFGGLALLLYLILFSWAHVALGKHWSGLLEIHQDHVLVTHGPYRFIRHPMYSAFFLSAIGFFLLSANWFIAALYLSAVAFMYFDRVSSEEAMMVERFGDSYKQYMITTGRLCPRVGRSLA